MGKHNVKYIRFRTLTQFSASPTDYLVMLDNQLESSNAE